MNAYHEPVIADGARRCSSIDADGFPCRLLPEEHETPSVWRAWMDSRSFGFEAYGVTEEDAREAVRDALERHTAAFDLSPDWYHPDDISAIEYRLGVGYRNREPLAD
jgi:hypothetical protein